LVPVIGIAAGGHAKVVIEILRHLSDYELIGLLDSRSELHHTTVLGVPVLGDDNLLAGLHGQGVEHAFIGLGTVGDSAPRRKLYEKVVRAGFTVIRAVHPQALISPSAQIGQGVTIMAGAIINAAATLGANVIINTGAIVEHDCVIGDHVHIATGAQLASTVRVGAGTHIGVGATIRQCISIGENVIVGAGAVVIRDVNANSVVAGVPARALRKRE